MEIKSYRGKAIDMNRLRLQNEKNVALGNMGVNARGDKLGKGGKVVQTREEIVREHYQKHPAPVQQVSIHEDPMADREAAIKAEAEEMAKASEPPVKATKKKASKKISEPVPVEDTDADVKAAAAQDDSIDFK